MGIEAGVQCLEAEKTLTLPVKGRIVDVLRLIPTGMQNSQIAEKLFVSTKTVKWHLTTAYKVFGVENRIQLARELKRYGL